MKISVRMAVFGVIGIVLAGCGDFATRNVVDRAPLHAAIQRDLAEIEGLKREVRDKARRVVDEQIACDDNIYLLAQADLVALSSSVVLYESQTRPVSGSNYSITRAVLFDSNQPWTFSPVPPVILDFADAAVKVGCLEVADELYRGLVAKYIGSAYTASRQRAQIGIDDIRAKR